MSRPLKIAVAVAVGVLGLATVGAVTWQTTQAAGTKKEGPTLRFSSHSPVVVRYVKRIEKCYKEGTDAQFRYVSTRLSTADQVLKDKVDIGCQVRRLTDVEKLKGLTDTPLGWQAWAVAVNARNSVRSLSSEDLTEILAGRAGSWKDLGGPERRIMLIRPAAGSSLHQLLDATVLNGQKMTTAGKSSSSDVYTLRLVAENSGAIGFVAASAVKPDDKKVAVVKLDGFLPTAADIVARKYPLRAPIVFVTKGKPQGAAKDFIKFCLTPTGQQMMDKHYCRYKQDKRLF